MAATRTATADATNVAGNCNVDPELAVVGSEGFVLFDSLIDAS